MSLEQIAKDIMIVVKNIPIDEVLISLSMIYLISYKASTYEKEIQEKRTEFIKNNYLVKRSGLNPNEITHKGLMAYKHIKNYNPLLARFKNPKNLRKILTYKPTRF